MTSIGDRMKQNYELPYRHMLLRRTPVIIRVDGKAFHSYTRSFSKPFDEVLMTCMDQTAQTVMQEIQGCTAAYTQSDEISFLLQDYKTFNTEPWLGYVKSKVESIAASMVTAVFNKHIPSQALALFDARSFNVPREEVSNYFLGRMKDWQRNSLSMYARSLFSHKEIRHKKSNELHEMIHSKGHNWASLTLREKNGRWTDGHVTRSDILPTYESVSAYLHKLINCDQIDYAPCRNCGEPIEVSPATRRSHKVFCSDACRMRDYRKRLPQTKRTVR